MATGPIRVICGDMEIDWHHFSVILRWLRARQSESLINEELVVQECECGEEIGRLG